jgi:hypothetical protein
VHGDRTDARPVKAGDRVKTDRRDALKLSRLFRGGELTPGFRHCRLLASCATPESERLFVGVASRRTCVNRTDGGLDELDGHPSTSTNLARAGY